MRASASRIGKAAEEAWVQDGVEHAATAAHDACKARRRSHDAGDETQQARIGPQQGKELHTGGQLRDETIKRYERLIRLAGLGQRFDQQRLHFGQQLTRARCANRLVAPMVPAADGCDDPSRVLVAHLHERLDGAGIVLLSSEHQVGIAARELRHVFEQRAIMALHALEMRDECCRESGRVHEPGKAREAQQPLGIGGQRLRLLVGNHLQPVLDPAQELVAVGEVVAHLRLDPRARDELVEGAERFRLAQVGLAAARDQLLRLREKLDLANAAAADLDVVAGDADGAEPLEGMDLALHGVNVGDSCEVEILAPYERRQLSDQ